MNGKMEEGYYERCYDIPPIEVKKEIASPTNGGTHIAVSTPETGNVIAATNLANYYREVC